MKKRIVILSAVLCLALAGCGGSSDETEATSETTTEATTDAASSSDETSSEESTDSTTQESETEDPTPVVDKTVADEGIDSFITLGEYKGLDLTKNVVTVSDDDIQSQIDSDLKTNAAEIEDGTVEDGDIVNIDYEGKIDGTAFDGGSSEGYDLTIGSGSFIDDFEEQLIGCKTGETTEVTVTFPEDYGNEELNGKDAVFTVTINAIKRPDKEITDEWVKNNSDFNTVEEYKENIRTEMEATNEESALSTMQNEAFSMVYSSSTPIQYPQDMVDEYTDLTKQSYETYASYYGMEYDEFASSMGITDVTIANAAKSSVKTALIVDAICEKEGINTDSDLYKTQLTKALEDNGYSDYDAAIEAGVAESDIDRTVKYYCALDVIISNANITEETEATETEATAETTEATTEAE